MAIRVLGSTRKINFEDDVDFILLNALLIFFKRFIYGLFYCFYIMHSLFQMCDFI